MKIYLAYLNLIFTNKITHQLIIGREEKQIQMILAKPHQSRKNNLIYKLRLMAYNLRLATCDLQLRYYFGILY